MHSAEAVDNAPGPWLGAPTLLILGSLTVLLFLLVSRKAIEARRYPPGPPSYPLIGNILQLPIKSAWYKLTAWKQEYGTYDIWPQ